MPFRYEIITPNPCETTSLFREYRCIGGTLSCSDGKFKFDVKFKNEIDKETLDKYNFKKNFSIRKLPSLPPP